MLSFLTPGLACSIFYLARRFIRFIEESYSAILIKKVDALNESVKLVDRNSLRVRWNFLSLKSSF